MKTPRLTSQQQFTLSKTMYDELLQATKALHEITVLRDQLEARPAQGLPRPPKDSKPNSTRSPAPRDGEGGGRRFGPAGPPTLGLRPHPARAPRALHPERRRRTHHQPDRSRADTAKPLPALLEQWNQVKATDLKAINSNSQPEHLAALSIDTRIIDHNVEDQIEVGDEN